MWISNQVIECTSIHEKNKYYFKNAHRSKQKLSIISALANNFKIVNYSQAIHFFRMFLSFLADKAVQNSHTQSGQNIPIYHQQGNILNRHTLWTYKTAAKADARCSSAYFSKNNQLQIVGKSNTAQTQSTNSHKRAE